MYTGQVASISNREDWVSDFVQIVDEDTGSVLNILNPDIGFDASVYIRDMDGCQQLTPATIANGGVVVSASDVADEPGLQWSFSDASLGCLCAGTYMCGLKVTANGRVSDVIVGTLAVIEGNR